MFKKALSCIMILAMLATLISVPTFAADTVVNPNLLFSADFDEKNPTPTAIDTEIVSVGAPTMVNDGNVVKLAYDGSKKGVAYSVSNFDASENNVIMFDINRNSGGASYFYIELWDANGVGKVYRIRGSYLAKNYWFTYMIKGDGTAYRKAVGGSAWEVATVDSQNSSNGIAGTNKLGFLVNSGNATTVTYDVDNVSVFSSLPSVSVTVPEKFGEKYAKNAVGEDFEGATNIFTKGDYGTGMDDIVSFIPEAEGSENNVMDIDFSKYNGEMGQWTQNIKSIQVPYPAPAVGFNVSFNYRRLDDYVNGDLLYFGTSYDAATRLVANFNTSQFDKGEWYNITYNVHMSTAGKAAVDSKSVKRTKLSTGETSALAYETGAGWSPSVVGNVAICASNNVDAAAVARRNIHWQLDDIVVSYQGVDPVKTELYAMKNLGDVKPIIAAYDENGLLVGTVDAEVNTVTGGTAETEFDVLESGDMLKNAMSVKLLYWDSLENAKAYADAVEIGDSISGSNVTSDKTLATFELGADMIPAGGTGKYTLFAYTVPFTVSKNNIPAFDANTGDMLALIQSNSAISEFQYDSALYDSEKQDIVIVCNAEGATNAVVSFHEVNDAPAFKNVAMLLGADITQRNFTWYSLDGAEGKLTYQKKSDMIDGAFSSDAKVVTAGRCHSDDVYSNKNFYYQNEAVMTDLEPGETYVYQLSNGESKSEMHTIKIGDDDSSFSFAFGGDAQVGGSEHVGYDEEHKAWGLSLKQITTAPEFEGIEFFLSAGDQIDTAPDGTVGNEAQYDIYLEHEEFKTLPQAVTLGNHDAKMNGVHMQHFNEPNKLKKADGSYYGEMASVGGSGLDGVDYYFVYNSVLFMHINLNNFDDKSNGLPESRADDKANADEHIEFINRVLEETKDNKDILWKVVYCHQSPYGSSYHGNYTYKSDGTYSRTEQYDYINAREYLLPHFYNVGVDLVLSGHDHVYTRTHIIKPTGADTNGHYFGSAEITPYADGNYTYEDGTTVPTYKAWTDAAGMKFDGTTNPYIKVASKPVKVTDPDGFFWVTGATSSGSQVNNMQYENHYAAVAMKANTRHVSRIDITPTTLTLNTYNLGKNTTEDITLVDTFTVEKTAKVAVGGVSVDDAATIAVGQTKALNAKLSPAQPSNKNVTWASDNEAVAKVDENGVVTAIAPGTANITVTTEDGEFTATCVVTVVDAVPVTAITLPETATIEVYETKTISASVAPETATTKTLKWSSSDEAIATVDENGNVTAHKYGEVTITAAATDGSGVTAACVVTVTYIPATRTLNKTEVTLAVLESDKLTVTITPSNATYKEVTWVSSDSNVVEVNGSGELKAIAPGTATISAVTGEGAVDCVVTVTGRVTFEQTYEDSSYTAMMPTSTNAVYKRIQDTDGNWVLQVDGSGLTSANKVGTIFTTQLYSTSERSVPAPYSKGDVVVDFDVKNMSTTGHQSINIRLYTEDQVHYAQKIKFNTFELGEWYDIRYVRKSNGTVIGYYKKWSDAAWTEVKTTNNSSGTVFAKGSTISGQVHYGYMAICPYDSITDSVASASGTNFYVDNMRVYSPVAATGMTLAESSANLEVGEKATIAPVFTPSNATDGHVAYVTSDATVATVDRYGNVTAIGGGTATITATAADGGFTATYTVNVKKVVPEITVVKDGTKFTVTTNVTVDGEKVYIAAYNASDVMIAATMADYVADGTELTLTADGASYYKAFIWGKNAAPVVSEKLFN